MWLQTALGLEGSRLSRQPLKILVLNQPNLGNLIVQKRETRWWERNNINQIS